MKWLVTVFLLVLIVSGCGNKIPEPQYNQKTPEVLGRGHSASAESIKPDGDRGFEAKYFMKGNSLYVDCFLRGFSLSPSYGKERAKIRCYMDGKRIADYQTAAFIVKKMPQGRHEMLLEILKANGQPAGLKKGFTVEVNSDI
ncbi:hypothetical protein [Peribacillus glennii]|uniref:Lipoprotein n=1 Tax=Peribacillus glennii TaxID=2303991 RepID=A0A372LBX0_9BACI|nr:hypothetical protein [Peribacillus glennii]RFU63394.1 hypothetical protein D0466_11680 [Peribacillus glennii]